MVDIRRARVEDAAGMARVHVASWRSTYRGIVPDPYLANVDVNDRTRRWVEIVPSAEQHTFVAERDGEVIGFINGGAIREPMGDATAELNAIYLEERVQRQGIGTRLLQSLVADLRELHHESMIVWVLAANPATGFYAAKGAVEIGRKEIDIGGVVLPELAYVWRRISALARS